MAGGLDNTEGSVGGGRWCGGHLSISFLVHIREQALVGLIHVAVEGLGRSVVLLSGVMVSETRPRVVVAGFDGV